MQRESDHADDQPRRKPDDRRDGRVPVKHAPSFSCQTYAARLIRVIQKASENAFLGENAGVFLLTYAVVRHLVRTSGRRKINLCKHRISALRAQQQDDSVAKQQNKRRGDQQQ